MAAIALERVCERVRVRQKMMDGSSHLGTKGSGRRTGATARSIWWASPM